MAGHKFGVALKAGIVRDGKVLVLYKTAQEAQHDPDANKRIDLPGGRLEFGERPVGALRREVLEEVGLEVEIVQPAFVWDYVKDGFQLVGITYYCRFLSGEVQLSIEHERYEWLSREEIASRRLDDADELLAVLRLAGIDC